MISLHTDGQHGRLTVDGRVFGVADGCCYVYLNGLPAGTRVSYTEWLSDQIMLDYGADGRPVGVEFIGVDVIGLPVIRNIIQTYTSAPRRRTETWMDQLLTKKGNYN